MGTACHEHTYTLDADADTGNALDILYLINHAHRAGIGGALVNGVRCAVHSGDKDGPARLQPDHSIHVSGLRYLANGAAVVDARALRIIDGAHVCVEWAC